MPTRERWGQGSVGAHVRLRAVAISGATLLLPRNNPALAAQEQRAHSLALDGTAPLVTQLNFNFLALLKIFRIFIFFVFA